MTEILLKVTDGYRCKIKTILDDNDFDVLYFKGSGEWPGLGYLIKFKSQEEAVRFRLIYDD